MEDRMNRWQLRVRWFYQKMVPFDHPFNKIHYQFGFVRDYY